MKTLKSYVALIKTESGSDYAKAKKLGITKQAVYKINDGGGMKDETAVKLAKLIGIDEKEVLLAAMIARTKDQEVKRVLENISNSLGIAASILVALNSINPTLFKNTSALLEGVKCILC